jgi:hypothetical protein
MMNENIRLIELNGEQYLLMSGLIYNLQYQQVGQVLNNSKQELDDEINLVIQNESYLLIDNIICNSNCDQLGIIMPMY